METEKIKKIQKKIKIKISSLVVYAGFLTSLITSVSAGQTLKLKKNLETDYQTAKIEYIKEIQEQNEKNEQEAKEKYEQALKDYEKELKEAARFNEVIIQKDYQNVIIENLSKDSDYKKYGIITKKDLLSLKKLTLRTYTDGDINFMRYCTNLEELTMFCPKECMNQISKLTTMPNLKKFTLYTNVNTFAIKNAQTIYEKMPNIEELEIPTDVVFEPNAIESMTQLKKLSINPYLNCDIDFKKLTFLEELKITSEEPYDIAIWFNSEEYNYLKENGVKVTFKKGIEEKYLKISNEIDNILDGMNIDENSSDDEILYEIMKYAVKNFSYDEEINKYTTLELIEKQPSKEFYKGGNLYADLEKDTQICGNYASFVEAMYDRLRKPEESFTLVSNMHAWNQININGKEYYVDSTWVDTGIVFLDDEMITTEEAADLGILDQVNWYKQDPKSKFFKYIDDGSHNAINTPNYKESTYTKKEFNPTIKETTKVTFKTVEKPTLDAEIITPNTEFLEIEKENKEKEYDKKIKINAETALATLVVAIITRINKKRKEKEQSKTNTL